MYNHTVTITVPASQAAVAAKIGRALDPDSGGADSFSPVADTGNIRVTTPCTADFAAQIPVMIATPSVLYEAVIMDYERRWPDLIPPTLAECIAFCGSIIPEPEP